MTKTTININKRNIQIAILHIHIKKKNKTLRCYLMVNGYQRSHCRKWKQTPMKETSLSTKKLSGFTEGVSLGRTTPMRYEPNHIRHWHHSQPKTLRQWVYGPWSLYGALLSQYWSMCFAIFFFFILRIQKIMLNFYLFNIEKLKKKWKKTIITMELFFRTSCCEISIYRINKIWE